MAALTPRAAILLTANTFGYWLRDDGTSLAAIGFISWVGFALRLQGLLVAPG